MDAPVLSKYEVALLMTGKRGFRARGQIWESDIVRLTELGLLVADFGPLGAGYTTTPAGLAALASQAQRPNLAGGGEPKSGFSPS